MKEDIEKLKQALSSTPTKEHLLQLYNRLKAKHPRDLLPLETELPDKLNWKSRDEYRISMTMILSQGTADKPLTAALASLFHDYPNMDRFQGLSKEETKRLLKSYNFQVDGPPSYNVDRFWRFKELYFRKWNQVLPNDFGELRAERGYGPKFMAALAGYVRGNANAFPLDRPGFRTLCNAGFYDYGKYKNNYDQVRQELENKLRGETDISLIDFHELLRYEGQTSGKSESEKKDVIIGWSAWRLLSLKNRDWLTQAWIREHLVKNASYAKDLWNFYLKITS